MLYYFLIFTRLRLFQSLRLLNSKNFPMPTFIKEPTSIRDLRVIARSGFDTRRGRTLRAGSFAVPQLTKTYSTSLESSDV